MRARDGREGQATLEAALAFPVVLLAILLVVQVGLVVRDVLALWNAAQQGARVAALTADERAVGERVREAAGPLVAEAIEVALDPEPGARRRGVVAKVRLRYVTRLRMPLVGRFVDTELPLDATAAVRLERAHPQATSPPPSPTAP